MRVAMLFVAAALALAACGKPAAEAPMANTNDPTWLEKNAVLPGWITIAQGSDGSQVTYDPKSITRDQAAGTADVWVQVRHKYPLTYKWEDGAAAHELTYVVQRRLFRFRCEARQVANVETRYMRDENVAAQTFETPPKTEADWRTIDPTGIAAKLEGPACRST